MVNLRHFYPNAEVRFPALLAVPVLDPLQAILISGGICEQLTFPFNTVYKPYIFRHYLAIIVLEGEQLGIA